MSVAWRKLRKDISDTCHDFDNVIMMVSGGVDSMFMMDLVSKSISDKPIHVLHFQHAIRPNDHIDRDLVEEQSARYGFGFSCGHGRDLSSVKNQEAVAREQRWGFAESVIDSIGGSCIVLTAHHYDDQIESFFMNSLRGKRVDSLVMKKTGDFGRYVKYKPLLQVPKETIYDQSRRRKLQWVEDVSNQESIHERNIFRNQIIPEMMKIRNIRKSMQSLITELGDTG